MTEPDRIVGELLQPGGYLKLIELGLEGKREYIPFCSIHLKLRCAAIKWLLEKIKALNFVC